MKFKIGAMLFLLVKLMAFSEWEVVEVVDQFKEKSGSYAIENRSFDDRNIRLNYIEDKKVFLLEMEFTGKVREGSQEILLKIDNEEPLVFKGKMIPLEDGIYKVEIPETYGYFDLSKNKRNFKELLKEMRKGEVLKIRFSDSKDDPVIEEFDLKNFNEAYEKLSDIE